MDIFYALQAGPYKCPTPTIEKVLEEQRLLTMGGMSFSLNGESTIAPNPLRERHDLFVRLYWLYRRWHGVPEPSFYERLNINSRLGYTWHEHYLRNQGRQARQKAYDRFVAEQRKQA